MKIHRGKISYLAPILFLPGIFTLFAIFDGELFSSPGLFVLFWIPFLILVLVSLGYKLEIGNGFVRNSFLGFTTMKLSPHNIESVTYGGMGLWNSVYPSRPITHGKGLALLTYIAGTRKTYGISEKLYGKKAIEEVKSVLEIK